MIYLVSAPTRVGSHYLMAIIGSTGEIADKTHDPRREVDYKNICLIILNRRNRFRAIMSALVTYQTKQYNNYVPMDIESFTVGQEEFLLEYKFNKFYEQKHDLSLPWKRIEYLYFEDFLNYPDHVFEKLNITRKNEIIWPQKSPFRYQDLVTNVDECREFYQHFEDTVGRFMTQEEKLWPTQIK